jgi:hypothetical protein
MSGLIDALAAVIQGGPRLFSDGYVRNESFLNIQVSLFHPVFQKVKDFYVNCIKF